MKKLNLLFAVLMLVAIPVLGQIGNLPFKITKEDLESGPPNCLASDDNGNLYAWLNTAVHIKYADGRPSVLKEVGVVAGRLVIKGNKVALLLADGTIGITDLTFQNPTVLPAVGLKCKDLALDNDGVVWAVVETSNNSLVYAYQSNQWILQPQVTLARRLLSDSDGNIWVAAYDQIYVREKKTGLWQEIVVPVPPATKTGFLLLAADENNVYGLADWQSYWGYHPVISFSRKNIGEYYEVTAGVTMNPPNHPRYLQIKALGTNGENIFLLSENNCIYYYSPTIPDRGWHFQRLQGWGFDHGNRDLVVNKKWLAITVFGAIELPYQIRQYDVSVITEVAENPRANQPTEFRLDQNFPNPFNPETTINYSLPRSMNVKLIISDILGREIETLVNEKQASGEHQFVWNAKNRPSGIYFAVIITDSGVKKIKMSFVR